MKVRLGDVRNTVRFALHEAKRDFTAEMQPDEEWVALRQQHLVDEKITSTGTPIVRSKGVRSGRDVAVVIQRGEKVQIRKKVTSGTTYSPRESDQYVLIMTSQGELYAIGPHIYGGEWLPAAEYDKRKAGDFHRPNEADIEAFTGSGMTLVSTPRQLKSGTYAFRDAALKLTISFVLNMTEEPSSDKYVKNLYAKTDSAYLASTLASGLSWNDAVKRFVDYMMRRDKLDATGQVPKFLWSLFRSDSPDGDALDFALWMTSHRKKAKVGSGVREDFANKTGHERIESAADADDAWKVLTDTTYEDWGPYLVGGGWAYETYG